jgi:hypothetical protein
MTYVEADRSRARLQSAATAAGLFGFFMLSGALYIIWSKIVGLRPVLLIAGPIALIFLYAGLLALARFLRLRDDQAGDNLYYLGFLYTLTSLGVSLWEFSSSDSGDKIVTNFGIAVSSTIVGIALRVLFNQLRQDPMEVERTARLQLADAARSVKQELDATVFEMASFRRAAQQSFEESVHEFKQYAERILHTVFDDLEKLPERSAAPLNTVSKNTEETIAALAKALGEKLRQSGEKLTSEEERLISSASSLAGTLKGVDEGLRKMQTPEGIIEIKLQPFIRGFTKVVTEHSAKIAEHLAGEKDRWGRLERLIEKFERGVSLLSERSEVTPDQIHSLRQDMTERLDVNLQTQRDTLRRLTELEKHITAETSKASVILNPRRWWETSR